jgi:hypothetical protein
MKLKFLVICCLFIVSESVVAQQRNGFHIVFHAMKGHLVDEEDIEYFDWRNKEIKLKRDTCIGCLYRDVFTMYQLTTDVDLEVPHFTVYIDTVKIFDGYFAAMNPKWPLAPIMAVYGDDQRDLEIVKNGIIKFKPYKSLSEIEAAYDSLIHYYHENPSTSSSAIGSPNSAFSIYSPHYLRRITCLISA